MEIGRREIFVYNNRDLIMFVLPLLINNFADKPLPGWSVFVVTLFTTHILHVAHRNILQFNYLVWVLWTT